MHRYMATGKKQICATNLEKFQICGIIFAYFMRRSTGRILKKSPLMLWQMPAKEDTIGRSRNKRK